MEDVKSQLATRLKSANNVLVTVNSNPSVDQLAGAIGLTLILNKLNKHATVVFSGVIPSTIEFLQPEKSIEKNTDSLRDFIISLDKAKADKLRYKIEENFVKIFITPYHTAIDEKDLIFSQGDFNVDVVIALGVHKREELDMAITAHGRILHDATVVTINTQQPSTVGSINWIDKGSSSLCEMLVNLSDTFAVEGLVDAQIANALLTGIVAETERFSNAKTSALTMNISSKLLADGANQQLVSAQLQTKMPEVKPMTSQPIEKPKEVPNPKDGSLQIDHSAKLVKTPVIPNIENSTESDEGLDQVLIDSQGNLKTLNEKSKKKSSDISSIETHNPTSPNGESKMILEPPAMEGQMNSINEPNEAEETSDVLSTSQLPPLSSPILSHDSSNATDNETLNPSDIPTTNKSHDLNDVRGAIDAAIAESPQYDNPLVPIDALNAQPLGSIIHPTEMPKPQTNNLVEEDSKLTKMDDLDLSSPPPPVPPPIISSSNVSGNTSSF